MRNTPYKDLECGEKTNKQKNSWKMSHKHCITGIWIETLNKVKNVKYALQVWIMGRKLKNVKNETHTSQDIEYGEKH